MSQIDGLLKAYHYQVTSSWEIKLARYQKVWYAVYDPLQERRLRLRMSEFARITREAQHLWAEIDLSDWFAQWMASHEYRQAYFEAPGDMDIALNDFTRYTISNLQKRMTSAEIDQNTVVALSGLASLFGLASISKITDAVTPQIRGRLLAFFPGHKDGTVYYLLDARAGYNYVGTAIMAKE